MDSLIQSVTETIKDEMDIKLEQTKQETKQEIWGATLTYGDIEEIKAILNN
jgi:hypothetical protein